MAKLNRRDWVVKMTSAGLGMSLTFPLISKCAEENLEPKNLSSNKMIGLNSNENPFGPSKKVIAQVKRKVNQSFLYPNDEIKKLEKSLAKSHKIPARNVIVTAGSREALKAIGLTYGILGGHILTCSPTYEALLDYAEIFGANIKSIPLKSNYQFDLDGIKSQIYEKSKLIFICNPNNPTGLVLDSKKLNDFCKTVSPTTPIIIDEVYQDYLDEKKYNSAIPLIKQGYNVIVTRSFSKLHGLAGLRIGYMVAPEAQIKRLRQTLMANTNILAVFAAQVAMKDSGFRAYSLKQNQIAKQMIYDKLTDSGIQYLESHTNFVFFKLRQNINSFRSKMLKENIKVGREFSPMSDWCRVSTGTVDQMEKFIEALDKCY